MTPLLGLVCLLGPDAALLRDLASPDAAIRLRAVAEVERRGADAPDAAYLAALAPLLREADLPTRGLAALAVHRHVAACDGPAPDALVVALAERLRDADRHVAAYCRQSLLRLAPHAAPRLGRWLAPGTEKPPLGAERLAALDAGRLFADQAASRPAVVALLWRALSDADEAFAEKARVVLADVEAAHRVPTFTDAAVIRAAFHSPNGFIRMRAFAGVAALGRDAYPNVVLLLDSSDRGVRSLAVELLGELVEQHEGRYEPAEQDTLQLLDRLRRREWMVSRWNLLRGRLQRIADVQSSPPGGVVPPREVDPQVEHWLRVVREPSADWPGVTPRLRVLGDAGHRALEARLEAADPTVRLAAAEALYRLRDDWRPSRHGLTALAGMLSGKDAKESYWAAVALRHGVRPGLDVPPALPDALAGALRSPDRTHRALCTIALAGCGLTAEGHLVRLIQDDDTTVQFHAVVAVRHMVELHGVVPLATKDALQKLVRSPDRDVARAVMYLGAAQPPKDVPERKETPP